MSIAIAIVALSYLPAHNLLADDAGAHDAAIRIELAKLADSSSEVRAAAIELLASAKDGRVGQTLEAFRLGSLKLWKQRLVVASPVKGEDGSFSLKDALSGQPIVEGGKPAKAPESGLITLAASRKERRDLVIAIRFLALYSADQPTRLSAVRKLGDLKNIAAIDNLEEIIASDTDAQVVYRARESVALLHLGNSAAKLSLRRTAAKLLGEMGSARAAPLLVRLLEEDDSSSSQLDPPTRAVCRTSLSQVESYQRRVRMLEYIFSGLSLGSVLILMALGLSIVFGQMGVINMAHGELMMIGAYATYEVQQAFGHSMPDNPVNLFFLVALPVSFLVAGLVGWLMEKLVVRHLYHRPLETLLATWGLGLMLIQVVRIRYGDNIGVNSPSWLVGGVEVIQDFHVSYNRLFIIGLTSACVAFVYWLLNCTKRGLLLRATVQNREMAAALGVNTRYEDEFTFAFGAGLAGIAGCALTLIGGVTPDMGQNYIVDSFLVVVTGGVGEIAGAVWAGLGLGVLTKILEPIFSTIWARVIILALVVAFIQYRPEGLFPPKGRLADD
ncbi:MAG: urea ABC transporter permease subunit UrtB [Pirellulales bacterium]|nr:urea ABC transporter permease subunit UrtB [Pirellulales bacterium]